MIVRLRFVQFNLLALLVPFILSSQNCSRRIVVEQTVPVVAHHAVDYRYQSLQYIENNLPDGHYEKSLSLNLNLDTNRVDINSVRIDGLRCAKTFVINSLLTNAFQEALQSMSYGPTTQASQLFPGDKFITIANANGPQDLVLDASKIPEGIAKVAEPQSLYFMIQGLINTSDETTVESCM